MEVKTRTLRIACAGVSSLERWLLINSVLRANKQYRVQDLGSSPYAFCKHAAEAFDIIFVGAKAKKAPMAELVRSLRVVSDQAVIILLAEQNNEPRSAAIADALELDAVISYHLAGMVVMEDEFFRLLKVTERYCRMREFILNQDALRSLSIPAVTLDEDFHIVFSNPAAELMLDEKNPFCITDAKKIECLNAEATQKFYRAIYRSAYARYPQQDNALIRIDSQKDGRGPAMAISIPKQNTCYDTYTYNVIFFSVDGVCNDARALSLERQLV